MIQYSRVMSRIWISHVTDVNESCYTYECSMNAIWMSLVRCSRVSARRMPSPLTTYMNESRHSYEYNGHTILNIHVTHMNKSCQTFESAMSHMNESCPALTCLCKAHTFSPTHMYEDGVSRIRVRHVKYMNESRHTYECNVNAIWMSRVPSLYTWMSHVTHINAIWMQHICVGVMSGACVSLQGYGVATVSRIDKIKGLFCRILSLL